MCVVFINSIIVFPYARYTAGVFPGPASRCFPTGGEAERVCEVGVWQVLKVEEAQKEEGGLLVVLNKEVIRYQPHNASAVNSNNQINVQST